MAPGDVQSAFAAAAAQDGIVLQSAVVRLALRAGPRRPRACGQGPARPGHRRAGHRGARAARGDLRAAAGRRLGPARRAREPPAARRARARADRDRDRGRRGRALHLVPADGARPLPARCRRRVRPRPSTARCAASGARGPTASTAGWPPRASGSAGASASAPTTTRCATSPRRPWVIRRCIRIAAVDGDGAAAYARHRDGAAGPQRRLRLGSCSSVAETLTVEQRPHLTRTL